MNAMLNIAIAAEFELCEKIAEALEQSQLGIAQVSVIEMYPFSEEQGIRFQNKSVAQIKPEDVDWSDYHYLFFAGDINHVASIANAAEIGCIVIDMNGVCSVLQDVPVVIPTVNASHLEALRQRNIVSLPDPQVTQLSLAIAPLAEQAMLKDIVVTSLLPASYTNADTVSKLAGQTARLLNGIPLDEDEQRMAFDVFPMSSVSLKAQTQKIFPQFEHIVFHSIQVPVFYGMGQLVTLLSDYELETDMLRQVWESHDWLAYHAEKMMTPVTNGEQETGEDVAKLHVSAVKGIENGIQFWSVADEQRFNLAFMGVKLAELIYQQGY
ncbi:aspartate-semialdehyde dehydrogenase [Pasteurella multocida subsp. multocida OH4807]|nr:aspartate-semialdehyde dehydrogenase [Pasteurella multocida subsp. multocida OH4807]